MLSKMEKQILKVSYIYGLYQQIRYIILIFITLALSYYLKEYFNIIILLSGVILLRIIYGIIYYKLIRIEIYKDHLSLKEGVFTSSVNFIELYRVKDYSSYQPFFMKVFGIMNYNIIINIIIKLIFQMSYICIYGTGYLNISISTVFTLTIYSFLRISNLVLSLS